MKDYLISILYCGEDEAYNYFFKSDKKRKLSILRDFYKEMNDDDEEEVSLSEIEDMFLRGEDIVMLLVDLEAKKILIENNELK